MTRDDALYLLDLWQERPDTKRLVERFRKFVEIPANDPAACWLWTGATNYGYGLFNVKTDGKWRMRRAHRLAYELLVGPIPEGLTIDHLCRNRLCINPRHLEPVTLRENIRRGEPGKYNTVKTHCPQGHPYSEENTYRWRNERRCKTCEKARRAAYVAANPEKVRETQRASWHRRKKTA